MRFLVVGVGAIGGFLAGCLLGAAMLLPCWRTAAMWCAPSILTVRWLSLRDIPRPGRLVCT